jgi:hypothetical protein
MANEAAWWIHNLFLFIIFFMAVPPIVRPGDDVACETLPSEVHIVKGQFGAKDKYTMSNITEDSHTMNFIKQIKIQLYETSEVLTEVRMKIFISWDLMPCRLAYR